ncbi:MAG: hypothetical protein GY941_00670 [Planctomycetes bacterium]|nr:hypothetical protein [Planctomycetota bacterium]
MAICLAVFGFTSHMVVANVSDAQTIIDNGDDGTTDSYPEQWPLSNGPNSYGSQSVYGKYGSGVYLGGWYLFRSNNTEYYKTLGELDVYVRWTVAGNRCTQVPIEVYSANAMGWNTGISDIIYVDQSANGGQWNYIGTWSFDENIKVLIYSFPWFDECSTSADAVRYEPAKSSGRQPPGGWDTAKPFQ